MKITIDELNAAYEKVNEYKLEGYPIKNEVYVDLDRNPLIDEEFFDDKENFVTTVKLKFVFDKNLGKKGSYILATEVDIIDKDEDYN